MKYKFLVVTGLILTGIITTALAFMFEKYFWLGLLVYVPFYFLDRKYSSNHGNKTFEKMGVKKYLKIDKPLDELVRGSK